MVSNVTGEKAYVGLGGAATGLCLYLVTRQLSGVLAGAALGGFAVQLLQTGQKLSAAKLSRQPLEGVGVSAITPSNLREVEQEVDGARVALQIQRGSVERLRIRAINFRPFTGGPTKGELEQKQRRLGELEQELVRINREIEQEPLRQQKEQLAKQVDSDLVTKRKALDSEASAVEKRLEELDGKIKDLKRHIALGKEHNRLNAEFVQMGNRSERIANEVESTEKELERVAQEMKKRTAELEKELNKLGSK